ncbi:MAG: SGNH/GDSL hydrolase family protein [Kiritimatiellia bacterium]|nr:SGNH/GDSL hydrolase family protein [Kiritimatiellia bacterium]
MRRTLLKNRYKEVAKRLALSGFSLLLVLGAAEAVLRLMRFSAPLQPITIVGREGVSNPDDTRGMLPDSELQVRFNPGAEWRGRRVNQLGFLGREVEAAKKPGTVRVICMGDSCTASGVPPYADFLHERLTERPPTDQPWEAFNMAVHGYSTEHGLRLFHRQTRHLEPDYVTLFYGWNDHWRAHTTDRLRLARRVGPIQGRLVKLFRRTRLAQFVSSRTMVRQVPDVDNFVLRVPHEEYRQNLRQLVAAIRRVRAVPILMTAPRASALTPLLVKNRQVARLEDAIRLHDEYAEITREVAIETGAALLDLARIFEDEKADALFSDDGIHHVREGRERIAREIYECIAALAEKK